MSKYLREHDWTCLLFPPVILRFIFVRFQTFTIVALKYHQSNFFFTTTPSIPDKTQPWRGEVCLILFHFLIKTWGPIHTQHIFDWLNFMAMHRKSFLFQRWMFYAWQFVMCLCFHCHCCRLFCTFHFIIICRKIIWRCVLLSVHLMYRSEGQKLVYHETSLWENKLVSTRESLQQDWKVWGLKVSV